MNRKIHITMDMLMWSENCGPPLVSGAKFMDAIQVEIVFLSLKLAATAT